jgi:carbonic anhydrase
VVRLFQVNVAPGGRLLLRGVPYTLLQYHFHAPAEHAVDGARAAMEAHLVHRSDAGEGREDNRQQQKGLDGSEVGWGLHI